jgi:hypothetical protein
MKSPHISRSRRGPFLLVIAVALAPACDGHWAQLLQGGVR